MPGSHCVCEPVYWTCLVLSMCLCVRHAWLSMCEPVYWSCLAVCVHVCLSKGASPALQQSSFPLPFGGTILLTFPLRFFGFFSFPFNLSPRHSCIATAESESLRSRKHHSWIPAFTQCLTAELRIIQKLPSCLTPITQQPH